jgi:hypothetical protein
MIAKAVGSDQEGIYGIFLEVMAKLEMSMDAFTSLVLEKQYEQLLKSRKKEMKLELIKRDEFLRLIR